MDLYHCMQSFVEVVEQNSFALAAKRRFRSAPQLSKEVSWLEQEVGAQLLTRTTRKLSMTEAGEQFYRYAKQALDEYLATKQNLQTGIDEIAGPLRVTVPVSIMEISFMSLPTKFLHTYPKVQLELMANNRVVDLVAEKIDLALRNENNVLQNYQSEYFATIHRGVFASPDYLKKHGIPKKPEDLVEHNCLLHNDMHNASRWIFKAGQVVSVQGTYHSNMTVSLIDAAVSGLGMIYMSHHNVKQKLKSGELLEVLVEYERPSFDLVFCYRRSDFLPKKVQAFIQFVKEYYQADFL